MSCDDSDAWRQVDRCLHLTAMAKDPPRLLSAKLDGWRHSESRWRRIHSGVQLPASLHDPKHEFPLEKEENGNFISERFDVKFETFKLRHALSTSTSPTTMKLIERSHSDFRILLSQLSLQALIGSNAIELERLEKLIRVGLPTLIPAPEAAGAFLRL